MFVIAWEYLTGRAVASHPTDRARAEWPPHPDRVFQALVAAWGETGRALEGKMALEWLEKLPPPSLVVPETHERAALPVYVPVNDVESGRSKQYGDSLIALLPSQRGRKDRRFPSLTVGDQHVAMTWTVINVSESIRRNLVQLCAAVTHIGHSSSLVRMWITDESALATYMPSDTTRDVSLRVFGSGRLDALIAAYANGGADWKRPPLARWQGYIRASEQLQQVPQGVFGDDWIVLKQVAGSRFDLRQSPAVAEALRKTLMKAADGNADALALISGHAADGKSLEAPHVAFVPLAHVGNEHADGHLMGVAVVLPRCLPYEQRDACLRVMVAAGDKVSGALRLVFGPAGEIILVNEECESPPWALRPENWCRSAKRWASVMPVVLDRLPPRSRKDYDGWAAEQVAIACERIGLPRPEQVSILPVSRFTGAPTCTEIKPLPRRTDGGPRWHVHVDMIFGTEVHGPVLLGAGRYRGYGLCRPCMEEA